MRFVSMRVPSIRPRCSRALLLGAILAATVTVAPLAGAQTPADAAGGHQPSAPAPVDHLRSPYAAMPGTGATGLLPQEVEALTKGEGMALAMAAEMNGYPGPRHVLDAASAGQLGLGTEQREAILRLFERMRDQAQAKGQEILRLEEELATRFRHGHIDEASLAEALDRIGRLRTELRRIHLRTHLETRALLTPEQLARYKTVRGYDAGGAHEHDPRAPAPATK
jgi:Spy/CpxP family protein refolding chaperone